MTVQLNELLDYLETQKLLIIIFHQKISDWVQNPTMHHQYQNISKACE